MPEIFEPTSILGEYGVGLQFEDIPSDVVDRAKLTIADVIGVMTFGSTRPSGGIATTYAERYGMPGDSRVIKPGGTGVDAGMAALANGVLAHSFELDGATRPPVGVHPSATIFPAALAVAQQEDVSGAELIAAFVAGSEIAIRIGRATGRSNERRGFHSPGTTGPFGAAIAASRLLGLGVAEATNAIGIAGSLAGGLRQFSMSSSGGMVKALHFGRAAESGVLAARFTALGFTAPSDILEGRFGFLRSFCDEYDVSELTRGIGEEYLTMSISMKRFACHRTVQPVIHALLELRLKHNFSGDDIETLELRGSNQLIDGHLRFHPLRYSTLLSSFAFCIAVACYRDANDPRSFDEESLEDPRIRSLCSRITLLATGDVPVVSEGFDEMIVGLRDRRELRATLNDPNVAMEGLPNWEAVYGKYQTLTQGSVRADEVFSRLRSLESEVELRWLAM
jgi:2-methylcitrate dehydratase PrpD